MQAVRPPAWAVAIVQKLIIFTVTSACRKVAPDAGEPGGTEHAPPVPKYCVLV